MGLPRHHKAQASSYSLGTTIFDTCLSITYSITVSQIPTYYLGLEKSRCLRIERKEQPDKQKETKK